MAISKQNLERRAQEDFWIWYDSRPDYGRSVVMVRQSHFPGLLVPANMTTFETDLAAAIDTWGLDLASVPAIGDAFTPYSVSSGPLSSNHRVRRLTEGNFIAWYDELRRIDVLLNQMYFPTLSGGALNQVSAAITDLIDTYGAALVDLPTDAETLNDGDVKAIKRELGET